jgi:hypothetical protein
MEILLTVSCFCHSMLNINCTKYAPGFLSLHLKHDYTYSKPRDLKHGTVRKYGRHNKLET